MEAGHLKVMIVEAHIWDTVIDHANFTSGEEKYNLEVFNINSIKAYELPSHISGTLVQKP